jgi:hypothetical protein
VALFMLEGGQDWNSEGKVWNSEIKMIGDIFQYFHE